MSTTTTTTDRKPTPRSILSKPKGIIPGSIRHRSTKGRRFAFSYDSNSPDATRKFLQSNIPKGATDRMKLLAGTYRMRGDARWEVRALYYALVRSLAKATVTQMQNEGMQTAMLRHLTRGVKQSFGHTYYPAYIVNSRDL